MRLAFVLVGLGTIAIGLGPRATLSPGKRVAASWIVVSLAGLGFILAGAFNTDPTGETDLTATGTVHLAAALVLFLSLVVSSWLLRGVFSRDANWSSTTLITLLFAIALTVTFLVSFLTGDGGPVGLTQRIFAGVIMAWLIFLGWSIRTRPAWPAPSAPAM